MCTGTYVFARSHSKMYLLWVMAKRLKKTGVYQGLANFFCNGPDSKYFRLCELRSYVRSLPQLLNSVIVTQKQP